MVVLAKEKGGLSELGWISEVGDIMRLFKIKEEEALSHSTTLLLHISAEYDDLRAINYTTERSVYGCTIVDQGLPVNSASVPYRAFEPSPERSSTTNGRPPRMRTGSAG